MQDEYTVSVTFKRYLSDDQEIATKQHPTVSLQEALQLQLRDELQEAFIYGHGLAGFFEVGEVQLQEELSG